MVLVFVIGLVLMWLLMIYSWIVVLLGRFKFCMCRCMVWLWGLMVLICFIWFCCICDCYYFLFGNFSLDRLKLVRLGGSLLRFLGICERLGSFLGSLVKFGILGMLNGFLIFGGVGLCVFFLFFLLDLFFVFLFFCVVDLCFMFGMFMFLSMDDIILWVLKKCLISWLILDIVMFELLVMCSCCEVLMILGFVCFCGVML